MQTSSSPSGSFGLTVNTPIDRVVMLIGRRLCFEDDYDFKVEKWIRVLKDNWIQTVGTLVRIPAGSLNQLGLPLALVVELERIIQLAHDHKPTEFFHLLKDTGAGDNRFLLKLSPGQKELVSTSFRSLLKVNSVTGKTGLSQFESDFYPLFFRRNPAGQRLFEMSEIATQSKAFIRMLYWIVENLDNNNLGPVLSQLGGRHLIYGVQDDEYQLFAHAVCDTFKGILGKNFTEPMSRAWYETLMALASLMKEAGEITLTGYQGQLKRERENGSWQLVYVTLMLNTLYVYKTKRKDHLSAQYPLRGVLQIQFPKDTIPNAFQLTSFDPPFAVRFAALDDEQFTGWITEFDWRIQAIQRVYKTADDSSNEESSEVISASTATDSGLYGLNNETARIAKATKHKIAKKQKKLQAKMEQRETQDHSESEEMLICLKAGLGLTDEEKNTVKTSWKCLVEKKFIDAHGVSKSGIGKLFEDFYAKLFEINPAGKRLFESTGLKAQGRALVSMIGMVVRCLDDFSTFSSHIRELGGRHKIYGVHEVDYKDFSETLAKTISTLLFDEASFPPGAVEESWLKVMNALSRMMIAASHAAGKEPFAAVVSRRMTSKGSWKKSAVSLQLDAIYVYTSEKIQKLRTSILFNSITTIDLGTQDGDDLPMPYGVIVAYNDDTATFCFPTKDEATAFMSELNWRVQAVLRVFKYDDDSASDGAETQSKKSHKFSLAKKKAKNLSKK